MNLVDIVNHTDSIMILEPTINLSFKFENKY